MTNCLPRDDNLACHCEPAKQSLFALLEPERRDRHVPRDDRSGRLRSNLSLLFAGGEMRDRHVPRDDRLTMRRQPRLSFRACEAISLFCLLAPERRDRFVPRDDRSGRLRSNLSLLFAGSENRDRFVPRNDNLASHCEPAKQSLFALLEPERRDRFVPRDDRLTTR